jgi:hypothetical protein
MPPGLPQGGVIPPKMPPMSAPLPPETAPPGRPWPINRQATPEAPPPNKARLAARGLCQVVHHGGAGDGLAGAGGALDEAQRLLQHGAHLRRGVGLVWFVLVRSVLVLVCLGLDWLAGSLPPQESRRAPRRPAAARRGPPVPPKPPQPTACSWLWLSSGRFGALRPPAGGCTRSVAGSTAWPSRQWKR